MSDGYREMAKSREHWDAKRDSEIERLRGLLRDIEIRARRIREDKAVVGVEASYIERIAALADAAVQPAGVTSWMCTCGKANSEYRDRCENCGGMETWIRAADPTSGGHSADPA